MKTHKKAHHYLDQQYLNKRKKALVNAGYNVSKWILFCEWAIGYGLHVFLHESQSTVSKYVYVSKKRTILRTSQFKVRFSNHRPNMGKEVAEDCDFFVGVANTKTTTTEDAIAAVIAWCNQTPIQRRLCELMDQDNAALDAAWGDGKDYLEDTSTVKLVIRKGVK